MPSPINVNFQSLDDRWTIGWLRRPSSIHIGAGKKTEQKILLVQIGSSKEDFDWIAALTLESLYVGKWEMIPFMHLNVVHMIMLRKHFEVISSGTLLGIFWYPFCAGGHFVRFILRPEATQRSTWGLKCWPVILNVGRLLSPILPGTIDQ